MSAVAKFERPAHAERKRPAGVGVCAARIFDVGTKNVEARKRIGEAGAGAPVVVAQQPVVLKEELRRVDFAGKDKTCRRRRTESESAVRTLQRQKAARQEFPSQLKVALYTDVAAVI